MTEQEKPKMISLAEQLKRDKARMTRKQILRVKKALAKGTVKTAPGMINLGNKDRGVPYHGKDRFGGSLKKFNDRIVDEREENGVMIYRQYPFYNNKYRMEEDLPVAELD